MKKSRSFLAVLIVSLSYVLSPVTAKADLWEVPVAPGESFRWVFVTSLTTDAYSHEIATYNTLVNTAASLGTSVTGVLGKDNISQIGWMAIASTPDTDAIDNIGNSTAPIYTPLGDLVAYDPVDMFDGTIRSPINVTEAGGTPPLPNRSSVWTGTTMVGLRHEFYSLGGKDVNGNPTLGSRYGTSALWATLSPGPWIDTSIQGKDHLHHLYAISEELTVVPVPSALILGATGLFSSTLGLIRLHRKHQEANQI